MVICGGEDMYICTDVVCDPCCDFCWYCVNGEYGAPISCLRFDQGFDGGIGYCDAFRCKLHESKPDDIEKLKERQD